MTDEAIRKMTDEELNEGIAALFEAKPTPEELQRSRIGDVWISLGSAGFQWWGIAAVTGEVVPSHQFTSCIEDAWIVVEAMRERGWLFTIKAATDGWIVNGRQYSPPRNGDWSLSLSQSGVVQEIGDTAPEAICRAALSTVVRAEPRTASSRG